MLTGVIISILASFAPHLSGNKDALLRPRPLRTVLDSFPSHGSSFGKTMGYHHPAELTHRLSLRYPTTETMMTCKVEIIAFPYDELVVQQNISGVQGHMELLRL